ncbi:unnamed protein product [Cyprideis torosa]|uniref:Uncharacterized protein n=1 Tax=Cyprideis torosa TaxID=163714 RepID=A0A7R8WC78_9CRUS|nr:unnamed protein product [Cyprideis torosa]CAG0887139.1 unnamed protein product [Cyprideis torosa]
MKSMFLDLFVALTVVVTIDGNLDLSSSSERTRIPIYEGQCDPPFTPVEGSYCYFLSYDQIEADWMGAHLVCSRLHPNGTLAEFETAQELVAATEFLITDNQNGVYPWAAPGPWIGAVERGNSNEFVWSSSSSPIEVPNWSPSRPNSPTSGDGVALDASNNFEWIDLSNGTEIPILCEIPSNLPPVDRVCPEGFVSLGDSCYLVYEDELLNWGEAQTFCGSLAADGRLVELETAEEIDLLKGHLVDKDYICSYYWIGGEEREDTNIFQWASSGQRIDVSDWYPGQPDENGSGDAIYLTCPFNWRWIDHFKSYALRFICEAPAIDV